MEEIMMSPLSEVLKFTHQKVIESFARNHNVSEKKACLLFEDMLRYLWLSKKHELDRIHKKDDPALAFQFVMHEEMRDIDNMWHNFILYTHDYIDFCNHYFGEYLHHIPDISEQLVSTPEQFENDLYLYLSYVYDHFGESIVKRWFAPYFAYAA